MIWLTADTHFSHRNVIEYCKRPFASVEEMNEAIINGWNDRVGPDDRVYHLGDFGLSPAAKLGQIRQKLKGKITLVRGNHDWSIKPKRWRDEVGIDEVENAVNLEEFILMHLPYNEGNKTFYTINVLRWLLCGHVHEKWRIKGRQFNVGIDVNSFKPISLDEIRELIKKEEACQPKADLSS